MMTNEELICTDFIMEQEEIASDQYPAVAEDLLMLELFPRNLFASPTVWEIAM